MISSKLVKELKELSNNDEKQSFSFEFEISTNNKKKKKKKSKKLTDNTNDEITNSNQITDLHDIEELSKSIIENGKIKSIDNEISLSKEETIVDTSMDINTNDFVIDINKFNVNDNSIVESKEKSKKSKKKKNAKEILEINKNDNNNINNTYIGNSGAILEDENNVISIYDIVSKVNEVNITTENDSNKPDSIQKETKKKSKKKKDKSTEKDDDDELLNQYIKMNINEAEFNSKKIISKKSNVAKLQSSINIKSKGLIKDNEYKFLSHKDPELTDEDRLKLKFGSGKNLVAIGPPRFRDNNWLTSSSNNNSDALSHQSPFSFGFDSNVIN